MRIGDAAVGAGEMIRIQNAPAPESGVLGDRALGSDAVRTERAGEYPRPPVTDQIREGRWRQLSHPIGDGDEAVPPTSRLLIGLDVGVEARDLFFVQPQTGAGALPLPGAFRLPGLPPLARRPLLRCRASNHRATRIPTDQLPERRHFGRVKVDDALGGW